MYVYYTHVIGFLCHMLPEFAPFKDSYSMASIDIDKSTLWADWILNVKLVKILNMSSVEELKVRFVVKAKLLGQDKRGRVRKNLSCIHLAEQ